MPASVAVDPFIDSSRGRLASHKQAPAHHEGHVRDFHPMLLVAGVTRMVVP
jgi:hypothetical protein